MDRCPAAAEIANSKTPQEQQPSLLAEQPEGPPVQSQVVVLVSHLLVRPERNLADRDG